MTDWTLAIDFGTTFTVGAVVPPGGPVTVISVDDESRMPSAVWLDDQGELVVGKPAINQAALAPDRFERTPKREVGHGSILLGEQLSPISDVVAAVLQRVAAEARRMFDGSPPAELRLTHPAAWADERLEVLRTAAIAAELPAPELIPEPVAAALRISDERERRGRGPVPPGAMLAIYDFGGGTFDAAVLRRTDEGFELAGPPGGSDPLGGEDIDRKILEHLSQGPVGHHKQWPKLLHPPDRKWRGLRRELDTSIRIAKENLSRNTSWRLAVPGIDLIVQISRPEFDEFVGSYVEQSVQILADTIAAAECEPSDLLGIYLVGGSSRIPLVATRVWQRFGGAPELVGDAKTVVAEGAAQPRSHQAPLARQSQPHAARPRGQQPRGGPQALVGGPTTKSAARFRSRLLLATALPLREAREAFVRLTLSHDDAAVRIDDAPTREASVEQFAQQAGVRWAATRGFVEQTETEASLAGVDGLERTVVIRHDDRETRWLERYAVTDARTLVVTAHETARGVVDTLRLGRPAEKHYRPRVIAELPPGWRAVERAELVRRTDRHRVVVESFPVGPAVDTQSWSHGQAQAMEQSIGLRLDGPKAWKALGRPDAVSYRVPATNGTVTRVWMAVFGGRGYLITIAVPELEALASFPLYLRHVGLLEAVYDDA